MNQLYSYCTDCEDYIWCSYHSDSRNKHVEEYIDKALTECKEYGYKSIQMNFNIGENITRTITPMKCIFSIHDENTRANIRVVFAKHGSENAKYILHHLALAHEGQSLCQSIFYPASSQSGTRFPLCCYNASIHLVE